MLNVAQLVDLSQSPATNIYGSSFASYEGYLSAGVLNNVYWLETSQVGSYSVYCLGNVASPPFGEFGINGFVVM